ncbi:opsin-5-like [Protopterus annectens]|uniref:opsin-5-like n=1 Tax=Protopterus annectens TaxID=7888 RepID=UPI001CFC14E4|nr:opsin-5-like [Protopterus annectens]
MANGYDASLFISSVPKQVDVIFGALYLLIGLLSIFGNTFLLFVAYRRRSLLKPAEFFIVNLAVSDLGMTLTLFPLVIPSLFAHRWLFSYMTCLWYAFCSVLFGLCSLASLTMLSSVCCMKVCFPAYGNKFSTAHARALLLGVWIYASIFAIAPLADWGHYGPEPYGTACCINWHAVNKESVAMSYIIALFVFCYMLPCGIIIASYCLIFQTMKVSRNAVQQHMSPQITATDVHHSIVKLSVAVCVGFLAAWTPYAVVALWTALRDATQVPAIAFALCAVFAKSSTLYNPIVYLVFKPNFRTFVIKDIVMFQKVCTRVCCFGRAEITLKAITAKGISNTSKISNGYTDSQGVCRNCTDAFECFSNYPKCERLAYNCECTPKVKPLMLNERRYSQTDIKRTVLIVLAKKENPRVETTEVTIEAVPFADERDLP